MAPLRQIRRSRRLSHKSPIEVPHYDRQGPALLHSGSDPSAIQLPPPSPSACTTTSSSPLSIVTHLPFTPGSSHTRNRKEGHIPRPPNAFMVFRSWLWNKDNLKNIERDNRNVSRIAGRYWNELSDAERAPFRSMADEAKARHAQLYPQYRYSPTSQKKPKPSQRRSQRSTDAENEKCKKVADMLLGGVTCHNLTNYLGEEHSQVHPEQDSLALPAEGTSSESLTVVPRNLLKRPIIPPEGSPPPHPRSKKQKTLLPPPLLAPPPSQYTASKSTFPATEERSEAVPIPTRTPELVYPLNDVDGFVPTDDIPYLSLDNYNASMAKKDGDDGTPSPSHLKPGAHTVFSGVKPEATSFVNSCVLGAYTVDALVLPASLSFTDFEIESYSSLDALVPLGSPVFTNPFEPSTPTTGHSALLGTLDQLFGQSVSPLTPFFSNRNLVDYFNNARVTDSSSLR